MIAILPTFLNLLKQIYLILSNLDLKVMLKIVFYKWTPIFVKGLYSTLLINTTFWKC